MRRAAIFLFAFLPGCTPMQWVKPDASAEQFARDQQECQQAAWREASNRSYWHQQRMAPVVGPGFALWPSGAFVDPFAHQIQEEGRLAQFCMESRGYQLVPAPKQ
jgi:hypothetical protein